MPAVCRSYCAKPLIFCPQTWMRERCGCATRNFVPAQMRSRHAADAVGLSPRSRRRHPVGDSQSGCWRAVCHRWLGCGRRELCKAAWSLGSAHIRAHNPRGCRHYCIASGIRQSLRGCAARRPSAGRHRCRRLPAWPAYSRRSRQEVISF